MRLLALAVATGALAAGTGAMVAAAAGPATKPTAAGKAAAKASLITLTELGKNDWTAKPPAGSGIDLACKGFDPSGKGVVETGAAGTDSFQSSAIGPFISQTTGVFASAKQATTLWNRAVRPGLIGCVVQTVDAIGQTGQGVTVTIDSKGSLPIKKATRLEAAYRVTATLSSAKVKYKRKLYFDVVLVGEGSTLSEITFSSLQSAVPSKVEAALAALVVHRIGLPTA